MVLDISGTRLASSPGMDPDWQGMGLLRASELLGDDLALILERSALEAAPTFTGEELERSLADRAFIERHAEAAHRLTLP